MSNRGTASEGTSTFTDQVNVFHSTFLIAHLGQNMVSLHIRTVWENCTRCAFSCPHGRKAPSSFHLPEHFTALSSIYCTINIILLNGSSHFLTNRKYFPMMLGMGEK